MKKLVLAALTLMLAACASIHEGNMANTVKGDGNKDLLVSGVEINDQTKEPFALIAVTFENNSEEWIRIQRVDVLIDDEAAKTISVVVGKDLEDWASAQKAREALDQYNRKMKELGLVAVGAAAAGVGLANNNDGLAIAGAGAMVGGAVASDVDAIQMARGRATNPNFVPEQHLYRPFSVPGKLFVRKWILLNKKVSQRLASLPIEITYVDGKKEIRNGTIRAEIR